MASLEKGTPPPGVDSESHRTLCDLIGQWRDPNSSQKKLCTLANEVVEVFTHLGWCQKQQLRNDSVRLARFLPHNMNCNTVVIEKRRFEIDPYRSIGIVSATVAQLLLGAPAQMTGRL